MGLMSAVPVGRLRNPILEHKIFVRMGVANIVVGLSWVAYVHMTRGLQNRTSAFIFTAAAAISTFVLVVSTHILSFPMWARVIITAWPNLLMWMTPECSELGYTVECLLIFLFSIFGELFGYVMQRSIRQIYLDSLKLKAEKKAFAIRNEQLSNEKERVNLM